MVAADQNADKSVDAVGIAAKVSVVLVSQRVADIHVHSYGRQAPEVDEDADHAVIVDFAGNNDCVAIVGEIVHSMLSDADPGHNIAEATSASAADSAVDIVAGSYTGVAVEIKAVAYAADSAVAPKAADSAAAQNAADGNDTVASGP